MTSPQVQAEDAKSLWLQMVPREDVQNYWLSRLQRVEPTDYLPKALCYVMLARGYIFLQSVEKAREMQQKLMNLLGQKAIQSLWRYVLCRNKQESLDILKEYGTCTNIDSENSLLFVTVLFITNEGQMALRDSNRCGPWAWYWFVESAHRLGKLFAKKAEPAPELFACVKFCVGNLLLNCATAKDIYAHQYLVKAFAHFQAVIERKKRQRLTRRIDSEIISSEQSLVALINMALCFLEFRQTDKCCDMIKQVKSLLEKSSVLDILSKHYFSAFTNYVAGVNYFECTSPLHSKLNAGAALLSAEKLNEFYSNALADLTRCADTLRQHFSKSALLASTLTMLGVVTANKAGEFNETSMEYLKQAIDLEAGLPHRSNTVRYLMHALRIAARLDKESGRLQQWKALYESTKSLLHASAGSDTNESPPPLVASVTEASLETASLRTSSMALLLPQSDATTHSHANPPSPPIDLQFTDCYRQECLDYFCQRLIFCNDSRSPLAATLCHLFIARFHLLRCAADFASQAQNSVRVLFRDAFNLHISRQNTFKLSQLRKEKHLNEEGMSETVAFCCALWQANEAKILLLNVQLDNNWRLNRISPAGYSVYSPKAGRFIRQYWHSFTDSARLRFYTEDWRTARRLLENSRHLSSTLRNAFLSSADWSHLHTILDCSLAEVCIDLNDMLPSSLLHDRHVKRCSRAICQSLISEQEHLTTDLSDTTSVLARLRIAAFDTSLQSTSKIMYTGSVHRASCEQTACNLDLPTMPRPNLKLGCFQEAYDSCSSAGLLDTPLHAYLHISVAIILYQAAIRDLTKPAYSLYNAAVLKLRRASRALELLEPQHPLTGDCYALLSVMYYNMMQLEDQEMKAMSCLRACLDVQRNLIANGCTTSRWSWRAIDVARKLAVYFSTSAYREKWSGIVQAADSILEMSRDRSEETRSRLLASNDTWADLRFDGPLMAERFIDPMIPWEGRHYLKETCNAMLGRVFPEENLPTYTEMMCYSHYLMKMWNAHESVCDYEWIYGCVPKCRLTRTSNDMPRRNDFLDGLNEYTLASPRDKLKILRRLQNNHEQLLRMCKPARQFDADYARE